MGRKRTFTPEVIEMYADKLRAYAQKKLALKLPLILAGFRAENGLNSENISVWNDPKSAYYSQAFSEALNAFKALQENDLAEGINTGRYNASAGIFTLKNVAGWRDEKYLRATVENLISFGIPKQDIPEGNRLADYQVEEIG